MPNRYAHGHDEKMPNFRNVPAQLTRGAAGGGARVAWTLRRDADCGKRDSRIVEG